MFSQFFDALKFILLWTILKTTITSMLQKKKN